MKLSEDLLERFGKCRILVVGDLMLDEYCRGPVERISPEAPVPILTVVDRDATLGGAGNVVQNLRSLGVYASVVGVAGEDETGEKIVKLLLALGTEISGIVRDKQRKSTRKVRFVSLEHGQQIFRMDDETVDPVCAAIEDRVIRLVQEKSNDVQLILCSDYLKGVLTARVLHETFSAARRRGIPTVVAPKDLDPSKYQGANILVPNVRELSRLAGTPMDGLLWLTNSAVHLTERLGLEAMLVTRGKEGMSLFELLPNGLQRVDIPTVAMNVYDVTGAGDTAIATFVAALAAGVDRVTAAHLANVAAGVVVGKRGTSSATLKEILAHLPETESQTPWTQERPWMLRTASGQ